MSWLKIFSKNLKYLLIMLCFGYRIRDLSTDIDSYFIPQRTVRHISSLPVAPYLDLCSLPWFLCLFTGKVLFTSENEKILDFLFICRYPFGSSSNFPRSLTLRVTEHYFRVS